MTEQENSKNNIFAILNSGKGCINEENISAFLGWLLNPSPNGLGDIYLKPFLEMIDIKDANVKKAKVTLEAECHPDESTKRYIDILIELSDKVIAIENKIWEQSKRKNQIEEQQQGLQRMHNDNKNKEIVNVLLSPESKSKESAESQQGFKNIKWDDLIEIIKEQNETNPNSYVGDFIEYMETKGRKNFKLVNEDYEIEKNPSGAYILYKDDEPQKGKAKKIFWEKYNEISSEKPEENKYEEHKAKYTTRSIGRLLYNKLK